jgi:hypothetical protein
VAAAREVRAAQAIALGSCGLYFVCRRGKEPQSDLKLGAPLPSRFWAAQGASFAFPGAEGLEAESPKMVPRVKGVWVNERFFRALMLALGAAGYGSERRRRGAWAPPEPSWLLSGMRAGPPLPLPQPMERPPLTKRGGGA